MNKVSCLFTVGLHLMLGFHFLVLFLLRLVSNSMSGDFVEVVVLIVMEVVVDVVVVVAVEVVVEIEVVVGNVEVVISSSLAVVALGMNLILDGLGNGLIPLNLEMRGRL